MIMGSWVMKLVFGFGSMGKGHDDNGVFRYSAQTATTTMATTTAATTTTNGDGDADDGAEEFFEI